MQIILWITVGVCALILFFAFMHWGQFKHLVTTTKESDPNSMARALVGIVCLHIQSIVGLALVAIIFAAISGNIISAAVGFPFVTSIATYILAFNAKEVFLKDKNK